MPNSPIKASSKKYTGTNSSKKTVSRIPMYTLNTPPKPVAAVGMSIRVMGRVTAQKQGRFITADTINPCTSINEESQHCLDVCELHRNYYFAQDAGPFIIPKPLPKPSGAAANTQAGPSTIPLTKNNVPHPTTPCKSSVCSSAATSPEFASSPIGSKSPPRLRHPSRLHTRDLTVNTFRIYVKHYLDNTQAREDREGDSDTDDPDITFSLSQVPNTPTRPKKRRLPPDSDQTPRPMKRQSLGITPKPPDKHATQNIDDGILGFTISHLRRVPELALLARRVVEAEAKRRAREERKKAKEQQTQGLSANSPDKKGKSRVSSSTAPLGSHKPEEAPGRKMKRLFRYAIRQLYDEGSIVLFDGPKHRLPSGYRGGSISHSQSQMRLWKSSSMSSSIDANNTGFTSTTSGSLSFTGADPDLGVLTDPDPDEESYIPLTPSYLCRHVEKAITSMMARVKKTRRDNKPVPGPMPSDILHHLRKKDDRWARLGEWHVKDALEWGKENERLWCVGQDRWEVCQ